jgi:hypothetical protein
MTQRQRRPHRGPGSAIAPEAGDDVKPDRRFVVYAGDTRYPVSEDVEAIGVRELATELLTS